jgi:signal transduction histidine kinase
MGRGLRLFGLEQAYTQMNTGLAAALVAMLVLPTLIMAAGFYFFSRAAISDETAGLLEATLREETARLGQRLSELENNVRAMASLSNLESVLTERSNTGTEKTASRLRRLFTEFEQTYGDYFTGVTVYDTAGYAVFPPGSPDVDRPDTLVLAALIEGKTIIVDKTADSVSATLALWLCTPVGGVTGLRPGILAARVSPAMLIKMSSDPSTHAHQRICLVDGEQGVVVPLAGYAGHQRDLVTASEGVVEALAGETGVKRYRDHHNREVIGAYTSLSSLGWGVLVEQDLDCNLAGLRHLRRNMILLFGGIAAVCIIFALFMSNQIIWRLERRDRESARQSEKLIAADKLATVGTMAASVAHEINNPLTTINVLIHNLFEESPPDEPQRMDLNIALDEIAKIKNIILRFLEFARPQEPQFSDVQVNNVVHRFCQLMRHQTAAKEIKIVERLDDHVPPVVADPSQIDQAILNILFNAIEATPVKGTIELSTAYTADKSVLVRIFNTGSELIPELGKKIFEPFFSTKAQGTGLGLSIVRMIMERHGGTVSAAAVPGQGTEFVLTLNAENLEAGRG